MTYRADPLLPGHAFHLRRKYSAVEPAGVTQPSDELEIVSALDAKRHYLGRSPISFAA